jgi:hypothetical protein
VSRATRLHRSQEICVTTNTARPLAPSGPERWTSGPEKWASGPEKWASRPARVAQSGRFGAEWALCWADTGATRTHRGRTRGADWAHAGPMPGPHSLGRVGAREADSRRGGWRLGAASRPGRVPLGGASGSSPLPCAPPLPQHFLCGPFLLTANHSLSEPTTLCYALKRGERGWRGGGG